MYVEEAELEAERSEQASKSAGDPRRSGGTPGKTNDLSGASTREAGARLGAIFAPPEGREAMGGMAVAVGR